MNTSGDVAEQVIRLSLEGMEMALRISGTGAKNLIAMLYAISKDNKQTMGKTRLINMLRSEKELKIFSISKEDLKQFSKEAKRYGVLYCALIDRHNKNFDGVVDIMVKAEDASKINRIVERFRLVTMDKGEVEVGEVEEKQDKKEMEVQTEVSNTNDIDFLVDEIVNNTSKKESEEITPQLNLMEENTPSEISLENKEKLEVDTKDERKSVKETLKEINEELKNKNDIEKNNKIVDKKRTRQGRKQSKNKSKNRVRKGRSK